MQVSRRSLFIGAASVALGSAVRGPAWAIEGDPAALRVQDFYAVLLDAMRHANALKMQGRYDKLYPTMTSIFDVPTMTRMAIGPDFRALPPEQQSSLREAFGKLLVATFASTFDDFKGETFTVDGDVLPQGSDRLVKTMFHPVGAPVEINYLVRGGGDSAKVIDIYLNGNISQLATWRSEYGAALQNAGYQGLMDAVQRQTDKFMRSF